MLTQRTALFLLSPSTIPRSFFPLSTFSIPLTFSVSLSPTPPIDTLILLAPGEEISRPRHRQPLRITFPLVIVDITLAREQTIADMYNSAGGIGKEYRGPQLCEKKDFFPRRLHRSHLQLYPRYVRAIVDARPLSLLSTTTTIEIVLRYP